MTQRDPYAELNNILNLLDHAQAYPNMANVNVHVSIHPLVADALTRMVGLTGIKRQKIAEKALIEHIRNYAELAASRRTLG